MNIQKVKTKNTIFYYLNKSYRDPETGRPRSQIVEKLGSKEDLKKKLGSNCDIEKWLKDYAKKKTDEEKNEKKQYSIKRQVKRNNKNFVRKNIGYLFLEKISYELGLDKICKKIEKEEKTKLNLFDILICIVSRGLFSKGSSFDIKDFTPNLFINLNLDNDDIAKAVKILVKYDSFIQKNLYKNINKVLKNNKKQIYYTCSNYALALSELEYNKYSKKTIDNTVLVKVFYDSNFIPCGLLIDSNYFDNTAANNQILQNLKYRFGDAFLYVLPDSVKTSADKTVFNKFADYRIVPLRISKELSNEDMEWAIDFDDWKDYDSNEDINLIDLKNNAYSGKYSKEEINRIYGVVYSKSKEVIEEDVATGEKIKKNMLVTYNAETDKLLNESKMDQLLLFQQKVEERIDRRDEGLFKDSKRFKYIREDTTDQDNYKYYFSDRVLSEEHDYYGFNLVLEDIDVEQLLSIMKMTYFNYNFVDVMFRNVLQSHVVNQKLTYKESLISNFLIDYIEISIFKVLEHNLNDKKYRFWNKDILDQLANMDIVKISDNLWAPIYKPSRLTDKLHKQFGLNTDFNVISDEELKQILFSK